MNSDICRTPSPIATRQFMKDVDAHHVIDEGLTVAARLKKTIEHQ